MVPELWGWTPVHAGRAPEKWLKVKDQRSGLGLPTTNLDNINRTVSSDVRYSKDLLDVWSPPAETLKRGYGDCEDMALLKRSLFLEAGGKEEDTCFLIVFDQIARMQHAVILINDKGWKLLDAYNSLVLPIGEVRDYTPQFAYMGNEAWTFGR